MTIYSEALEQEKSRFENCLDVHDLPAVFHYWSNKYIRPKFRAFGFESADAMFAQHLEQQCRQNPAGRKHFVSLGSGNCELETELALELRRRRQEDFTIECIDLNAAMLDRGRATAEKAGVAQHLTFTQSDLNSWIPSGDFHAAIANQSLHHVLNLEELFGQIGKGLKSGGTFIISDMIGRNGHLRWPEALERVHQFWRRLPPSYRINLKTGYYEELFQNWDCSVEGFEGVRAQDILPRLLRDFHFRLFLPFGNIIDPFVDRCFGHHFDVGREWDLAFIDEVHQSDEAAISSGLLTPTHMLAVVGKENPGRTVYPGNLSPEFCVRKPANFRGTQAVDPGDAYDWLAWPHKPEQELAAICRQLSKTGLELKERTEWVSRLKDEVAERTAWHLRLTEELAERTRWALDLRDDLAGKTARIVRLQKDLEERTNWALDLETQLEERTAWSLALRSENTELTAWGQAQERDAEESGAWALRLREELESKTRHLSLLEKELHGYLHNPFRYFARLVLNVIRRIGRLAAPSA